MIRLFILLIGIAFIGCSDEHNTSESNIKEGVSVDVIEDVETSVSESDLFDEEPSFNIHDYINEFPHEDLKEFKIGSLKDLVESEDKSYNYEPIIGALAYSVYQDSNKVQHIQNEFTEVLYSLQKVDGHTAILIGGMADSYRETVYYYSYDDQGEIVDNLLLYASGGDGGFTTEMYGYFENDYKYHRTHIECEYFVNDSVVCDTTKVIYKIAKNGKISQEKTTASFGVGRKYKIQLFNSEEVLIDADVSLSYLEDNLWNFKKFRYSAFERLSEDENTLSLVSGNVRIELVRSKFDSSKSKLQIKTTEGYADYLEKIDGKDVWGTDGDLPKMRLSVLRFWKNDTPILIPNSYFDDLFEPSLNCYEDDDCNIMAYQTDQDEIILVMNNSDGAGAYTAIFVFDLNGKVKERIIGYPF